MELFCVFRHFFELSKYLSFPSVAAKWLGYFLNLGSQAYRIFKLFQAKFSKSN